MTLVMVAASPLMIAVGALQAYFIASSTRSGQKRYGTANEVAQESLSGIRTVYSFVSEESLIRKHSGLLQSAIEMSEKKSHLMAAGIGFSFFFMFATYSLGFWYGGRLINNGEMLPGDIIIVFTSIMIGAKAIGSASQLGPDIAKAKGAASNIFAVIDRTPEINANEGGLTLGNI
jgi:ATP-binding cassette subfamily B (MDR/TAP) protein 1